MSRSLLLLALLFCAINSLHAGDSPNPSEPGTATILWYQPEAPAALTSDATLPQARCAFQYGACPPASRFWFSAEYLLWWTKTDSTNIPLLSTSSPQFNGIVGAGDTRVLQSTSDVAYNGTNGGRLSAGLWLDPCRQWGVEVGGFLLERQFYSYTQSSDATGAPLLAIPIFSVSDAAESSQIVASPGDFAGRFNLTSASRFWGYEANLLRTLAQSGGARWTALVGFRGLALDEQLNMNSGTLILDGGVAGFLGQPIGPGDALLIQDHFSTNNRFYGGQVGLKGEWMKDRWSLEAVAKIALGVTQSSAQVQGSTSHFTILGLDATAPGGLFALGTNSGAFSRDLFAVVPEVGVVLGYRVSDAISLSLGYNFLYWSEVARPSGLIDRRIDRSQVPSSLNYDPALNPVDPSPMMRTVGYWAQGLTVGMQFRY